MICRFLTQQDRKQVEKLWDSCFEKRSEPFFQYYFEEYCFRKNRVFGGFSEQGELITMMHLNPYTLQINGRRVQAPYIVGVATAEKFRRHHYMGKMLNECCELLRCGGTEFVFLMPIAERIYAPYGFVGVDYHTQPKLADIKREYELVPCDLACENFVGIYEDYMQQYNGVVRSEADWEKFLMVARLENNVAYLLQYEDKIYGYVITDAAGDVVEVISPKPLPKGNKAFIMAKCLQGQDTENFFGDNTYINEYF